MMPQMEPNQPIHEQSSNAYGAYEGNREPSQQQYEAPYQQTPPRGTLDDNYVEAIAQRMAQLMSQQSAGKIYAQRSNDKPPAGMRMALAIVSVVMVVGLAGTFSDNFASGAGLIGFLVGCLAIILVNVSFNGLFDSRHR